MAQFQLVNGSWPFAIVCGQFTNCTLDPDAILDPDVAGIGVSSLHFEFLLNLC
jgi:hypothetical protein